MVVIGWGIAMGVVLIALTQTGRIIVLYTVAMIASRVSGEGFKCPTPSSNMPCVWSFPAIRMA
jgi:hypothetical protein